MPARACAPRTPHTGSARPVPCPLAPKSPYAPTCSRCAVRQLLRAARAGLQSEIGLRAKLAADWARAEASAGGSSAKPVPELDGSLAGGFHGECLARNSRDAAAALSLSMRTFAWQALPLKQVAGNRETVQESGKGGSSVSTRCSHERPFADSWV